MQSLYLPRRNNGILESVRQNLQIAKRRTGGFSFILNFIDMTYFVRGKLNFDSPYNLL